MHSNGVGRDLLENFTISLYTSNGAFGVNNSFWKLSHGLRLARDNKTRWNSWYIMLQIALNLKDAILEYYENYLRRSKNS